MKKYLIPLIFLPVFLYSQTAAPVFIRSEVESEITGEGTRIDRFTVYSPSMDRNIKTVVVLPPAYLKTGDASPYPVLYTLHGYAAPYDTWAKMPMLRKQLSKTPFIYVGFDGDVGSCYLDSVHPLLTARPKEPVENEQPKPSYFKTFFFSELVPAIDHWYRVNPKARGITGFSMGGSGAMTYMLEQPEFFCSVSGLSTSFYDQRHYMKMMTKHLTLMFGTQEEFPERYDAIDHYKLIEKHLADGVRLPPLYQHIGSEDFLLEENHRFRDFAESKELDLIYLETPGGHNWKFWHPTSVGIAAFHWSYFQKAVAETAP
ncbi:alpha/beta hydrolase-fold protein [Kiritimatiellaeota bacterium B1221]|nr:alpha/beta hydrolase-fold protein [Kiritimatiellaeota bacterium B1221]